MEFRLETLRRRVAAYRCYLAIGSDIRIARQLLREIAIDEAELVTLEAERALVAANRRQGRARTNGEADAKEASAGDKSERPAPGPAA